MIIEFIKNNKGLITKIKVDGVEHTLKTPESEHYIKTSKMPNAIELTDGTFLSFKKAGGTAQTTSGPTVTQAWKYNWDNLRQHGEADDQWTVIQENTCRIIKYAENDEDWEAFKITDFLTAGQYQLLTPWKWSSHGNGGKWINGTTFEIAEDGTITFNIDDLEGETKLQIAGVIDNNLSSFWTAIEANPKFWFDHVGSNGNNHFYLYPDNNKQKDDRLSTIPFKQYKVSINGAERIWNA